MQDECASKEGVGLALCRTVAAPAICKRALVHRIRFPRQGALVYCAAPNQQYSIMRQLAVADPDKVPCSTIIR